MICGKHLCYCIAAVAAAALCLLAACEATPVESEVSFTALDAQLLTGQLPPTVASVSGDQAEAPCLLVGVLETDSALVLKTQLNPELEPSGIGSLGTELELPPAAADGQTDALSGVITTLSTDGQQSISAVFPLSQLAPNGPINQQWQEGGTGEYLIPMIVCVKNGEYCLRSLTDGAVFLPENPLPAELIEKALDTAEIGEEVSLSHCGIALLSIVNKAEEGRYTIEVKGFLSLSA
ncbi:MAG: hypothetical protein IKD93_01775 [Firmicutes bacterium]|nr:hypothetical protein [Bacillota bacterium]